ncbi:MAG: SCP2 sterol-binding domain-containing protein [bacterium]|nr:SCP2 sterol-binding domain-containing protein [bacterium]
MTYQTAFKKLKEKFENVDFAKLNDMAIQFTLSDEDCGGTFYAEKKNDKLNVEPYDYKDNDAVVDVTRATLTKILDGKLSIDKAIENGELTVKGDLEKIKAVADAIKAPTKAEKTAEAKTEVKTAETTVKTEAAPKKCAVKKCTVKSEATEAEVKTEPKKSASKKCAPKTESTAEEKPKRKCGRKPAAATAPTVKTTKTTK